MGSPMPGRMEIESHLSAVLASRSFASSKRCRDFLEYVARLTLNGQTASIKERTIAADVFGRVADYEPDEDSLVRVRAKELRKRLTQYYENEGAASPIRIELPVGSYVPQFLEGPAGLPVAAKEGRLARRHFLWLGGGATVGTAACWAGYRWLAGRRPATVLDGLWRPVFNQREPLLIFLPVLAERGTDHPVMSDRVGIGAAQAAIRLASFMTEGHHQYTIKLGSELSFADLRRQPSILLGAFSSYWTVEMSQGLRFRFVRKPDGTHYLADSSTGQTWDANAPTPQGYAAEDYALAARIFDPRTGQILMIAAGITTFGTQAAAEMLCEPASFAPVARAASADWETKSFQVVLHTKIIGAAPGKPRVVATHFW